MKIILIYFVFTFLGIAIIASITHYKKHLFEEYLIIGAVKNAPSNPDNSKYKIIFQPKHLSWSKRDIDIVTRFTNDPFLSKGDTQRLEYDSITKKMDWYDVGDFRDQRVKAMQMKEIIKQSQDSVGLDTISPFKIR